MNSFARLGAMAAAALAVLVGARPAGAQPPPPAPLPPELTQRIQGYDLAPLFEMWRNWVEGQKGAVTEALLAEPEQIEGERALGPPIVHIGFYDDFGYSRTADIRVYCRPAQPYGIVRSSCHYRLRRAYVPLDTANVGGGNALSRWTQVSFDARRVIARLRALRLPPETNWWSADRTPVFAVLPSPVPILRASALVLTLDSRDCPALRAEMERIEHSRPDWRFDFGGVGEDAPTYPPRPHMGHVSYRLNLLTPRGGGLTLEGFGPELSELLWPIMTAANACQPPNTPFA